MGKEIIHIEVDEDIAGIIGRVMAARDKVVAVVAPKNLGALRSAMNLKLLKKAARQADKVVAVVSDNPAMRNLAGSAGVALAPDLNTKPEVPEVEELAEGRLVAEEIMAGEAMSLSGAAEVPEVSAREAENALEEPAIEPQSEDGQKRKFTALTANVEKVWQKALLIGGVIVGALLIGMLVLFLAVKPSATVEIATRMETIDVRREIRFKAGDNDPQGGLFALQEKSLATEQSQEFEPTGEKIEGEKASGTITIRYCGPAQTMSPQQYFEANGKRYHLGTQISLEGAACNGEWRSTSAVVTAAEIGEEYNLAAGAKMVFSGEPNGYQTEVTSGGLSGGAKRTVLVVSDEDVRNALGLMDEASVDEGRSRLKASIESELYIFDATFVAESGAIEVTPKVGEAVGNEVKATVKRTQTYRIMTASKPDMERFAEAVATEAAGGRKVYEIGSFANNSLFLERVEIVARTGVVTCNEGQADCVPNEGTVQEITALLKTVARAGDEISQEEIIAAVSGQKYNDALRIAKEFKGVERVDIGLRPFWATRLPKEGERIVINIKADG